MRLILLLFLVLTACTAQEHVFIDRESVIPSDAVKITPEMDKHPPVLHSDQFEEPVPLAPPINTAGAEDSPFITADGRELYFFYTPDVSIPAEGQVGDGVTGIYVSKQLNGAWQTPERVWLQDPGKLSLDGCFFARNTQSWFCTAREGYTGIHWFTARMIDGVWQDWEEVHPSWLLKEVGELHIWNDQIYFHSSRSPGLGNYDIWMAELAGGVVQEPVNIEAVNSQESDGWPYLTEDGNELWFTRTYRGTPGIFRSVKDDDEWQAPELIVSQFAGEPTMDPEGNLYFVHHFYDEGVMLEADIYVAYRKN